MLGKQVCQNCVFLLTWKRDQGWTFCEVIDRVLFPYVNVLTHCFLQPYVGVPPHD